MAKKNLRSISKKEQVEMLQKVIGYDTKKETNDFYTFLDNVLTELAKEMPTDTKMKLGKCLVIEKFTVPAKSGTIIRIIDGEKKQVPYQTEERVEVKYKASGILKDVSVLDAE